MQQDKEYLEAIGRRIFGCANDLKRTPQALAADLGMEVDAVELIIAGKAGLQAARELRDRMVETYPVPLGELWIERSDTDSGVRLMTCEASRATARTFSRRNGRGQVVPYLEYRDTAMSRLAPYKPEWVQPIRVVDSPDPDDPTVVFNHGHLMHQCTFFVGEVNAYWQVDGRRYSAELDTGDSTYAAPYVPHSFTSRDPDRLGLLIAVTYAGDVQRALDPLARLGAEAAGRLAGDARRPGSPRQATLARLCTAESLSVDGLAERLLDEGLERDRATALAAGEDPPADLEELGRLAQALSVAPGDLLVPRLGSGDDFVLRRAAERPQRELPESAPCYVLHELVRTPHQPGLRGFEIEVRPGADERGLLRHHLHEYVYNFDDERPAVLHWGEGRSTELGPGDSAYVEPMVPHYFSASPNGARLLSIRLQGAITDAVLREYSTYDPSGRHRAAGESTQWF